SGGRGSPSARAEPAHGHLGGARRAVESGGGRRGRARRGIRRVADGAAAVAEGGLAAGFAIGDRSRRGSAPGRRVRDRRLLPPGRTIQKTSSGDSSKRSISSWRTRL